MDRFKMRFDNSRQPIFYPTEKPTANLASIKPVTALNAPMIDRVYKAKPGCSACGKKVA